MYTENRENKFFAFLIFLVWPFLSFVLAFRNYKASWAQNIVMLFVAYFGYTMVIKEGIDSFYYKDKFVQSTNTDHEEKKISFYEEGERESIDFVEPILVIIISNFTNNYKILFFVFGLIFGFFYSRNIWILLNRLNHPLTFIAIILLLTFLIINPFWNINGFRFWTATQVFIYGALLYFIEKKKIGILFIVSTFTIHFSFLIAISIFVIYLLIGNRITLYFIFFVTSLFIEGLELGTVKDNLIYIPEIFQERSNNYLNEEYAESIQKSYETANWYVKGHTNALHYAISAIIIVIYWKGRSLLKEEKWLLSYFCFILIFYGTTNILSSIPSASRFLNPASSMAISLFIVLVGFQFFKYGWSNNILTVSLPLLLIFIVVAIRIGFDTIGLGTVVGNPMFSTFMEYDIPLIDLLK